MASTTYEAVRDFWSTKAPWLVPYISTNSATGATNYGIDTLYFTDTTSVLKTGKALNGYWHFQPDDAVAGDRERQIGGNSGTGIDLTNGRIYPTTAWANAPQSAEQYEISFVRPKKMFDLMVQSLEQFYIPDYAPLGITADADMATSGTANYSISGAGSLSKVATATQVHHGIQSLFFNAGTAGEYVAGPASRVIPGRTYDASAIVRVDVGGPAAFVIWDSTNNAEIDSTGRIEHSLERFVSMQRTFTVPSTCEEVHLRVYCTGATDDIYIDSIFGPRKMTDTFIKAPSTVESSTGVRKLMIARYADQIGAGLYDADSRTFEEISSRNYHVRINNNYANPDRIEMRNGLLLPQGELWIEQLKKVSDVYTAAFTAAGETSSIPLQKALIGWASLGRICKHVLAQDPEHVQARATLGEVMDKRGEYSAIYKDYEYDLETPQYEDLPHTWSLNSL